ncbi:hypothetical protein KL86APRO_11330 [uncultured Alphaproteobacteria bacterium]|uniref:Uncharacterized protein n=1 Tax=uncultured Alphaproteobacteria bacterium TaxID=91750 RepID=A0A212JMP2_9PROT|nr:hypothetical protein KL86APRO_11330 [uncultured Alphaproteobacteria bacterium]
MAAVVDAADVLLPDLLRGCEKRRFPREHQLCRWGGAVARVGMSCGHSRDKCRPLTRQDVVGKIKRVRAMTAIRKAGHHLVTCRIDYRTGIISVTGIFCTRYMRVATSSLVSMASCPFAAAARRPSDAGIP